MGQAPWINPAADTVIQTWFQGQHDLRVLEIGCGQGWTASWLHDQGHRVTAVDISDVVIAQNIARWPDIDWRVLDMLDPTVDLGQFDVVIERGVLVVLNQAQDRSQLMANAARHLHPSGHVLSLCDCTEQRSRHDPRLSHRSMSDIVTAMEPHLRIRHIAAVRMPVPGGEIPAWFTVSRLNQHS